MRLLAVLFLAAAAALPLLGESGSTRPLRAGAVEFWSARDLTLDVERGARLRIGLDHADETRALTATIRGPRRGTIVIEPGLYSGEWVMVHPPAGRYRVRVTGPGRFRVRAKLETGTGRPRDARPNLQPLPPWDLTFLEPITNGSRGGVPRGRRGGDGCHREEVAEGARRCLRMAFGVRNAGDGPFAVFYEDGPQGRDRPLHQRVHRRDGSSTTRRAGTAYWHASHGHYHHDRAIGLQLLTLDGRPVKPLRRKGFAHRDELLREWRRFHPLWDRDGRDFGLQPGWADYYEWDRPGNYVDVRGVRDGRYVLRMTADPDGTILESDERDNVAYSVIEIRGARARTLESGRGSGPGAGCVARLPIGSAPGPDSRPC